MVFRLPLLARIASCVAVAVAQEPIAVAPRLIAHGVAGEVAGGTPVAIDDAAAFARAWATCGGGRALPAVDWTRERAWFVPLGRGRGGDLEITQVLHGRGVLVRIEGAAGAEATDDRFGMVAIARAWNPRDVAFETDGIAGRGLCAFRGSGGQGMPYAPRVIAPMRAPVKPQLFTDALAYTNFRRAQGMPADDTEGIDFAAVVLFVAPVVRRAAVEPTEPPDRLDVYQARGLVVVRTAREVQAFDAAGEFAAPTFGVHILPRVEGILQVDAPSAADAHLVIRVAEFAIVDPVRAPRLEVLRYRTLEVPASPANVCERVRTAAEWRDLRRRLPAVQAVPEEFCTFDGTSIVFVATEQGHAWPGFDFAVGEEEGVDVVTAIQRLPSGRDPGLQSHAFLAVVPDRTGQLAVVLRQWCVGPVGEKTLRVFPGQSR